jgi:hypothetical protein
MEDQQKGGGSHKIGNDGEAEKINILVVDTVSRGDGRLLSLFAFCLFLMQESFFFIGRKQGIY